MMDRLQAWRSKLAQHAPFNWPRKRKIRWSIAVVLVLLAYPVLGTLALSTGLVEWILKSDDFRVELSKPAYTIWPGKVRVKHLRILSNSQTQFILEANDVAVNVRMLELLLHKVHVTELDARDVLFQMRVQVKDTKGIEKRLAAYPPLDSIPGTNSVREATTQNNAKKGSPWTVKVSGLDIAVRELWFFEYRFLGKGTLRGGFTIGPHVMQVETAVQDLGPGELRFGAEQVVATNINGQITADIPAVDPQQHADASFMELVTARVNLKADVQNLVNIGAYAEGLEVSHGQGPLSLDLYMDKGKLGTKSHLDYETNSLHVLDHALGVETDLHAVFDAAGSAEQLPLVKNSSKSTYVSLARGNRSVTVQIHGHHEEAKLDTIQLSRSTDLKSALVRMPTIVCADLRDLPILLPEGTAIQIEGKEATASLSLDMDDKYWAHGPLKVAINNIEIDSGDVKVHGDVALKTEALFNPKLKTNVAENTTLTMRNISLRAANHAVDNWWMNVESKRMTFWNTEPSRFEGVASIQARDLEPVLDALADRKVISDLIPLFTSLKDFSAKTTIRTSGPVLDVVLESESTVWDAAGRVYKKGKQSHVAIVVGGQAVSVGIASNDAGLEIMPFAKTGWLNDRLRDFPKPLVQMAPPKP